MSMEGTAGDAERMLDVFDRELRAMRELIDARFIAAALAVDLAQRATDVRFENTNAWRQQLDRERADFAKIGVIQKLEEDIKRHSDWQARVDGALTLIRFMSFAGILGLIITLLRMSKVLP